MSPIENAAYSEALLRILEVEKTREVTLHLNSLRSLNQLPPELGRLAWLQTLDLSWCEQLRDLAPLSSLNALQTLDLSGCERIGDLTPLSHLTSLQTLDISWCKQIRDLSPISGLNALRAFNLYGCE